MKYFAFFVLFACLAFPVFSQQDSNTERFGKLSETMGNTLSNSNSNLEYYDEITGDRSDTRTYTYFYYRHRDLSSALQSSETRLDFLIRTHAKPSAIRAERNNYERLIQRLEEIKTEYDDWMKS